MRKRILLPVGQLDTVSLQAPAAPAENDEEKIQQKKRFVGVIAQDYEFVPSTMPCYFVLQNELAAIVASHYTDPTVLDLGAGTGWTSKAVLEQVPHCHIVGVDNEPTMLQQARINLAAEVSSGRVELIEQDMLLFLRGRPSVSADAIVSSYTLHNCDAAYRSLVLQEVARILRPNGLFVNNDKYATEDRRGYVKEISDQILRFDILKDVDRNDLRQLWIEHEIEDQLPERIMWVDGALKELADIGFREIAVHKRIAQYAVVVGRIGRG